MVTINDLCENLINDDFINDNKNIEIFLSNNNNYLSNNYLSNNKNYLSNVYLKNINESVNFLLNIIQKYKNKILNLENQLKSKKENKCSICMENDSEYIFIPCGHFCICANCDNQYNQDICPICRTLGNRFKVYQ